MKIISNESNERLDKYICQNLDFSRENIKKHFEEKLVFVNGKNVKPNYKVKLNDEIEVKVIEPKELEIKAEDIALDVVYEDDSLLVVNKERSMVVHPAPGNPDGTLVNALLNHCKGNLSTINSVIRPGIVHRIDKDTSGLLVVAKNDKAHLFLSEQLKEHKMERKYIMIVQGVIPHNDGRIEAPIGRDLSDRKKMAVTLKNSKPSVTHFKVLERFDKFTYVEASLETGRTHQIRVHMSHIGYPLLGDFTYGAKSNNLNASGQILHAKSISFIHPETNEEMHFDSSVPQYFQEILDQLRKN